VITEVHVIVHKRGEVGGQFERFERTHGWTNQVYVSCTFARALRTCNHSICTGNSRYDAFDHALRQLVCHTSDAELARALK
jgi:hypothetical protein